MNPDELDVEWKFEEKDENWFNKTPHDMEFFREGEITENLVRETVQNALDAKKDGSDLVKLRFSFSEIYDDKFQHFVQGLKPHIEGSNGDIRSFERHKHRVLTIEDFGTKGLTGKTSIKHLPVDKVENGEYGNFISFWRMEGESGKKGGDLGRWGIGKTTLHMSSHQNIFWGFTVPQEPKTPRLMGKALLKPHYVKVNGEPLKNDDGDRIRYNYGGLYADSDQEPIEDEDTIDLFRDTFNIAREDETGFSVIIPYIKSSITSDKVIRYLIMNYFYPIADGDLEVTIETEEQDRQDIILDSESLVDVASEEVDWSQTDWKDKEVIELMEFFEEITSWTEDDLLDLTDVMTEMEVNESTFSELESYRERYQSGEILGFKLPAWIFPDDYEEFPSDGEYKSEFKVFLQKFPERPSMTAEEFYIRSGIYLPDVGGKLGRRSVRGVVVAEEEGIDHYLGDAENISHMEWEERAGDFSEKYDPHTTALRFVKRSMKSICEALEEEEDQIYEHMLKDIFSIPKGSKLNGNNDEENIDEEQDQTEDDEDEGGTPGGETPEEPEVPDINPVDKFIEIDKTDSGFKLYFDGDEDYLPLSFEAECAYELRRRDPFTSHSEYDFDIADGDIEVIQKNCSDIEKQQKSVKATFDSADSSMELKGFDTNKEVIIRVVE